MIATSNQRANILTHWIWRTCDDRRTYGCDAPRNAATQSSARRWRSWPGNHLSLHPRNHVASCRSSADVYRRSSLRDHWYK